jgi:hypothetical protein
MARHDLKYPDIAARCGVTIQTARCWTRAKGPQFKPCPPDKWAALKASVGEV